MDVFAELVDGVARNRLTLAEISGLSPVELDAIYELAAEYVDVGRDAEAVEILVGLLALFPLDARYWRALGVALHRCWQLQDALAAYDAALLLAPNHAATRCYRAEVAICLGRAHQAQSDLSHPSEHSGEIGERAQRLLGILNNLTPEQMGEGAAAPAPALPPKLSYGFKLTDERPLPLEDSRFAQRPSIHVPPQHEREEVTVTARCYVPTASRLPKAPRDTSDALAVETEPTHTAIVPGRGASFTATDTPDEHTQTALVRRRLGALHVDDIFEG